MTGRDAGSNKQTPEEVFAALEKLAGPFPVKAVRVLDHDHQPVGLYLQYSPSGPPLPASPSVPPPAREMPADLASTPTPAAPVRFRNLLAAELERVARTSLPCSLLLFRVKIANIPGATDQIAAACWSCLEQFDIFAPFAEDVYAAILPAVNSAGAGQRARQIVNAIKTASSDSCQVSVGVVTCHAGEITEVESFIAIARLELARAQEIEGGGVSSAALVGPEDSCQVTVEERSELFTLFSEPNPKKSDK